MPKRIFNFIKESKRVFKITRKPQSLEFKSIVKVTGIGILIIGLIGFIIHIIWQIIKWSLH